MTYKDGLLFNFTERGIAKCFSSETGETLWKVRLGGEFSASPLLSDGKIWITNEDGDTFVFEAGEDEMKLIATNTIEEHTLGSLAVSNGKFYLRTDKALYCIGE